MHPYRGLFAGEYAEENPKLGWPAGRSNDDEWTIDKLSTPKGCFVCHRVWEKVLHDRDGRKPTWSRFNIERQVAVNDIKMYHLTEYAFGQVASASIQVTGHLRTLPLKKKLELQPSTASHEYKDHVLINGREQWRSFSGEAKDLTITIGIDEDVSARCLQGRLQFLPIFTKDSTVIVGSKVWVSLILQLTGLVKGQFKRIGLLEIVPDSKVPKRQSLEDFEESDTSGWY